MNEVGLKNGEIDIYLRELIEIYDIVEVNYPIFEEKKNTSKYLIKDNFLNFWFRYIYANKAKFEL
jgi:AAA+ ATPase superfamily predicted ATPase